MPVCGLFTSVIYRSINSKGISCFPKSEHGAIAGVIFFFTCVSAVVGPLAMGVVSDAMGHAKYGFALATGFAALLFLGLLFNWLVDPTREHLSQLDATEYRTLDASAQSADALRGKTTTIEARHRDLVSSPTVRSTFHKSAGPAETWRSIL
jgi:MFS family permease